jgi:hypothetical protein
MGRSLEWMQLKTRRVAYLITGMTNYGWRQAGAALPTVRSDSIRTSRVTDPLSGPKLSLGHRSQTQMPNGKNVTYFETDRN